ncbi:MAG: hypothetical protein ACYTJ0_06910 [Planctomycetota bacterium]|jgi:hypothetical protein
MSPVLLVAIALVVIAVMILGAWHAWKQAQVRREALAGLAVRLGWSFSPERDRDHDDQYAQFAIFRQGHSRWAHNTLTGDLAVDGRDYRCRMGDFHYRVTRGSGERRRTQTYRISYLILHLPFVGVPSLLIRPEGIFDRMAGIFGFDDIDFESVEFSRRFLVKSGDKRFAYDVIHPRMMEFLLSGPDLVIDIEHGACCLSVGRGRWSVAEFEGMLGWSQSFFEHWPDHVIETVTP